MASRRDRAARDEPARPFRGTIRFDENGELVATPNPPGGSRLQRAARAAARADAGQHVWTRGEEILFAVALATTIAAVGSFALLAWSSGAHVAGTALAVVAGAVLGWLFLAGPARDMRRRWWRLWLLIPVTAGYTIASAIALL